jgi:hypothetical protein
VSIATIGGIELRRVVVEPATSIPFGAPLADTAGRTFLQATFDSATGRVESALELSLRDGSAERRFHVVHLADTGDRGAADSPSSFPWLTLEWRTPDREVTLLDRHVAHSPLTVDGVALRGVHYVGSELELHAGIASPLRLQGVLLPSQRGTALGASWRFVRGASSVAPIVYFFDGASPSARRGAVATLLYRYGSEGDPLQLQAELGWGGKLGSALDGSWSGRSVRAWMRSRHRPDGFASLGLASLPGTSVDAGF